MQGQLYFLIFDYNFQFALIYNLIFSLSFTDLYKNCSFVFQFNLYRSFSPFTFFFSFRFTFFSFHFFSHFESSTQAKTHLSVTFGCTLFSWYQSSRFVAFHPNNFFFFHPKQFHSLFTFLIFHPNNSIHSSHF